MSRSKQFVEKIRLGVDLGNVIIDHAKFGTTPDYIRNGDYLKIPPVTLALESIRLLLNGGIGTLIVIYNASDVADEKILSWVEHWVPNDVINDHRFNLTRSIGGRDKIRECIEYGITHFIDDRVEVLNFLNGRIPSLFLMNPNPDEKTTHSNETSSYVEVEGWNELTSIILTSPKPK